MLITDIPKWEDEIMFIKFDNVFEIRKSADILLVEMENKKRLVLKNILVWELL